MKNLNFVEDINNAVFVLCSNPNIESVSVKYDDDHSVEVKVLDADDEPKPLFLIDGYSSDEIDDIIANIDLQPNEVRISDFEGLPSTNDYVVTFEVHHNSKYHTNWTELAVYLIKKLYNEKFDCTVVFDVTYVDGSGETIKKYVTDEEYDCYEEMNCEDDAVLDNYYDKQFDIILHN